MVDTISIFVLDDETVFLNAFLPCLKDTTSKMFSMKTRIRSFTSGEALLSAAEKNPPDLLIADIELTDHKQNGIDVASQIKQSYENCAVIYLTSYLVFAKEVFESSPLYFILKPEYPERLPKALMQFLTKRQDNSHNVIQVVSNRKTLTIYLDKLEYCEHMGKNVLLHYNGETLPVRTSIQSFYQRLPQDTFAICHQGYIINFDYVRSFTYQHVEMKNGMLLSIGRSHRDAFHQKYTLWMGEQI